MSEPSRQAGASRVPGLGFVAAWGPGLLVMLADTDAGNIITAAQAGAQWGYRLLPLPLLLIPVLFMVQELAARLGLFTGLGCGALIRRRFGRSWAQVAGAALAMATLGSLVTEFDGIAGVGEMYGVPRLLSLALTSLCLLTVVLNGRYVTVERIAIAIGMFQLSFFFVVWAAHPLAAVIVHDIARQPLGHPAYLYMGAALIGATFNPWMIFYQPAALAAKGLGPSDHRAARWDTAAGAILTQLVTASVLAATAATLGTVAANATGMGGAGLDSVGQISDALTAFVGPVPGRLVFGMAVTGASMVAAIVCSLAFKWGMAEVAAPARYAGGDVQRIGWVNVSYVSCVVTGAAIVLFEPDLVWLSIAAQTLNALLMPVLAALVIALASRILPPAARLSGWYLWLVTGTCALVAAAGIAGAMASLA